MINLLVRPSHPPPNWTGHKFTDVFTLLKTDGEWKIISKVFYLHPEG
jgi:hypothetical protein